MIDETDEHFGGADIIADQRAVSDGGRWHAMREAPFAFTSRDGRPFAGTHLIIDLMGARHVDDMKRVEAALREAVEVTGATLLHIHLHRFGDTGGISGVAVLAESHISIHSWPEVDYAAMDVFMCGDLDPYAAIPVFERAFVPVETKVSEHLRGVMD